MRDMTRTHTQWPLASTAVHEDVHQRSLLIA